MKTTPALDALLVRQTLVDQALTASWRGYVTAFIKNGIGMPRGEDQHWKDKPELRWMNGLETDMTRGVLKAVEMAETYHVTPAMTSLVDARADAWADDELISFEDLPSTAGMVHVPAGVRDIGSDGHPVAAHVLLWHRVGYRLRLMFFYSTSDPTLLEDTEWGSQPHPPPYMLLQIYDLNDSCEIPKALRPSAPLPEGMRSELVITLIDDEYTIRGSTRVEEWLGESGTTVALVPDRLVVWLFSCLRLMREELPAVERVGVPTGLRKGLVRRKLRNVHVTVIEYRHRQPSAEHGGTHEYSHRFFRRGHNRRVWYRDPETGELAQRTVWIKPTIVLADRTDLPLLLREHVNELRR